MIKCLLFIAAAGDETFRRAYIRDDEHDTFIKSTLELQSGKSLIPYGLSNRRLDFYVIRTRVKQLGTKVAAITGMSKFYFGQRTGKCNS